MFFDCKAEALTDCDYRVAETDTRLELTAGNGTATQCKNFKMYKIGE